MTTAEGNLGLDEQTSMLDLYDHPFRAQYGYEEWGEIAGILASYALESLDPAAKEGIVTGDDEKAVNVYAYPIIRKFNEFGYNSRVAETAVVTAMDVQGLLRKALGQEGVDELRTRPALVRATLVKLAKDSFVWGRTGNPFSSVKFGQETTAEAIPETGGVFFPDDIDAFVHRVSDQVVETTVTTLKQESGFLGRVSLQRRHHSNSALEKLTPRKNRVRMTREQWLRYRVGVTASMAAEDLVTGRED